MRAAMAAAEVGDDVYGEDPTVNALEEEVAGLLGHEAAVFVPSGTMGNQIALQLLVAPAEELLCHSDDHVVTYEHGGLGQHGGIQTRTLDGQRGQLTVEGVEAQLRPAGWGTVATRAVSVEQTHNRGGGSVYPLGQLQALRALTAANGVALHCDGARLWNASVATGTPLAAYGAVFDTLSVCLSKGLGAPVGSLVVSSDHLAARARVVRKRLGGGMRQAGVLAAAGRYALAHHVDRLAEDHRRAAELGQALDVDEVSTNIVVLKVDDGPAFASAAKHQGVLVSVVGPRRVRCVLHLDVDDAGLARAREVLGPLLRSARTH
ncbi:MAG: aminotransferase class I/II-fold pyridoxal phosphate-dependent enzyme [Actinomycetota bacterium]|nr:aminotransferase class I/II-fold pyridoxal phosphate-dependent enzyme [Actinomycetota bacterium]